LEEKRGLLSISGRKRQKGSTYFTFSSTHQGGKEEKKKEGGRGKKGDLLSLGGKRKEIRQ